MPALRRHDVLVQAARMYYLQNKSQNEIASALGLSRSSVSRILQSARERGVVEVRIHGLEMLGRVAELETALRARFGTKSVVVVARPIRQSPTSVVAEMAARLFEERLGHFSTLGLSWGRTVDSFVAEVDVEPIHSELAISPLVGGMPSETGTSGNTCVEVLAQKAGGTFFRFDSPAVVASRQSWLALTNEPSICSAIARSSAVEAAFIGIGSYGIHASQRLVDAMALAPDELAEFERQSPAGDICGRFFDNMGRPVGPPTTERIIGVTLEQLKGIPETIGMAGGVEKAPGVIGALRTEVLGCVILDEALAKEVLCRTEPGG